MGSGGTYTSAISMGGEPKTGKTELWDGTSWTEVTDMNTARQTLGGVATNNTSGMAIGGDESPPYSSAVELFTGAGADIGAWATETSMNTARSITAGAGTYTSALLGGSDQSPTAQLNESWNGSTWTEVADLNTAIIKSTGFGATNSSAIRCSGATPPGTESNITEQWNGSSWTEVVEPLPAA